MSRKKVAIDVSAVNSPEKAKSLPKEAIPALSDYLRKKIIEATSSRGGHLSSNLGTVEATIALCRVFDFPKDRLVFDVGHQCYAWKLLTGRSLENLNGRGGTSGFQKMGEGPYDPYEAGHAGTAASAVLAMLDARRIKGGEGEIIGFLGDGSLQCGLTLEALNDLGRRKERAILVLNDNEMAISPSRGAISERLRLISVSKGYLRLKERTKMLLSRSRGGGRTLRSLRKIRDWLKNALVGSNLFDDLGLLYLGPVDGHDVEAMERAFRRALRADGPVIVHIKTKKGKGYLPAEEDKVGYWHGVTPFDPDSGSPREEHPGMISWSHFFGDETLKAMEDAKNVLICPAMMKGSHMEEAFRKYPDRSFDPGIAEEHALTYAGAISLQGLHPIVSIYSTFLQRAYDELLHDCARMKAGLTLLVDRAGLAGANGDTHQGVYDPAFLMSIPGVEVYMPRTLREGHDLFESSLSMKGRILAIRYPHSLEREEEKELPSEDPFSWRLPERGGGPLVLALGPLGRRLEELIRKEGIPFRAGKATRLWPFREEEIDSLLKEKEIFVYDPYGTKGGFLTRLFAALEEKGYQGKAWGIALPEKYVLQGSLEEQLRECGAHPEQALEAFRERR